MSETRPLHVRVAEALGCKPKAGTLRFSELGEPGVLDDWGCDCPAVRDECPATGYVTGGEIRRYDTSWEATGPLLEKYGIYLSISRFHGGKWLASRWSAPDEHGDSYCEAETTGETPLLAICALILALKEAGKLP